jgi:hypothetical protein
MPTKLEAADGTRFVYLAAAISARGEQMNNAPGEVVQDIDKSLTECLSRCILIYSDTIQGPPNAN